jgi:hypothetical protein
VALIANLFVAGAFDARGAYACSCATVSLEKQIKTSDVVFSGEVESVEPGARSPGVFPPSLGRVNFSVKESWKGVSGETVEVYGHGPGASCGIDFDEGESYLVYAYRSGDDGRGSLQTGLCDATKQLEHADGDLRLLGPPEGHLPETGGYGASPSDRATIFAAVAALVVLAGALILGHRARNPG